jgi:hypothetical protein
VFQFLAVILFFGCILFFWSSFFFLVVILFFWSSFFFLVVILFFGRHSEPILAQNLRSSSLQLLVLLSIRKSQTP